MIGRNAEWAYNHLVVPLPSLAFPCILNYYYHTLFRLVLIRFPFGIGLVFGFLHLVSYSAAPFGCNVRNLCKRVCVCFSLALVLGTAPSCSSTPPPPFDDISEGSNSIHRHQTLMQQYPTLSRRGFAYREDTVR